MKDPYIQENGTLKNMLGITHYDENSRTEAREGVGQDLPAER